MLFATPPPQPKLWHYQQFNLIPFAFLSTFLVARKKKDKKWMQNKNDTLPLLYREYWVLINVVHTCLFFFLCLSSTAAKLSLVVHEFTVLSVIHSDYDGTAAGHSPGTSLLTLLPTASTFTPQWERKKDKRWTLLTLNDHPPCPPSSSGQYSFQVKRGIIFVFIILSPKLQLNSLAIAISLTTISHWNVSCLSSRLCAVHSWLWWMYNSERFMGSLWPRSSHLTYHRKLTTEEQQQQHAFLCDNFYY